MVGIQLFAFLVLTAGIVYLSRASLRYSRSHGFYRFFAFEAIAALVVLNAPSWFHQPFAPRQIAAWILPCLTWGAFLKDPGWIAVLLALSASAWLFATAQVEERENLAKFGEVYASYMQKTKRFLPYIFLF
jgi:hypothetical protein